MFLTKKHLSRRTVLKGAGVSLALPLLDAMIPAATAFSEYSAPVAISVSGSDRITFVDERCTIVTSAPASHNAAQMSCADVLEPITTASLPA